MIFSRHNDISKYSEKEILCNIIEQYIEIANKNNNVLDDYISIIALINQYKKQYPKYKNDFDYYIRKFKEKGIYDEYIKNKSNIAKQFFDKNKMNVDFVEEHIFGFIQQCSSRFMFYLLLLGLIGNPKTARQRYLLATIFERNSYCFYKEMIYYGNLYLNNILYLDKIKSDIRYKKEKKYLILMHKKAIYNMLGVGYEKDKNFQQALNYYKLANNKKAILYLCLRFKKYDTGIKYINKYLDNSDLNNVEIQKIIKSIQSKVNKKEIKFD